MWRRFLRIAVPQQEKNIMMAQVWISYPLHPYKLYRVTCPYMSANQIAAPREGASVSAPYLWYREACCK